MKHTKILATVGPATKSVDKLQKLIDAGVNAFRVNCSHGEEKDFVEMANLIREASEDAEFPVGLLFDISGPKLRLDRFEGVIDIAEGESVTFVKSGTNVDKKVIAVNHPRILSSVKFGERLMIDDGNLIFNITLADSDQVEARAINAGQLLPGKGINLPDTEIDIPTIGEKDKQDIETAVAVGADFIALSFVRSGDDIIEARKLLRSLGGKQRIIAKLEKREAIDDLDTITLLADGVMVARGDLGVELPPEELPQLQKRIIRLAHQHQRPVIVATQMLESMRFAPRATRAEINDVASAVFDYADAVMLSAETATGDYPVEAVRTMTATIEATEAAGERPSVVTDEPLAESIIPYTIAGAVSSTEHFCCATVTLAWTSSGYTARLISSLFPSHPVIALSSKERVMNGLSLQRSVYSIRSKFPDTVDEMLTTVDRVVQEHNLAESGDVITITGGLPLGSKTPTNFMMVRQVP